MARLPPIKIKFSLDYLDFLFYIFIRTDMLAICRIPCPLRTASVNLILKISLNYVDFYIIFVILIYARTCWPHAVSHVRCALQVNVIFIPI